MIDLVCYVMKDGYSIFPWVIFLNKSFSLFPLKGNTPVKILNRITPQDHTSAPNEYDYFLTISGHMYDGVPHDVVVYFF